MKIPCKHWRGCEVVGGGCCNIGAYARPSFGVCLRVCEQYDGPRRRGTDTLDERREMIKRGILTPCGGRKHEVRHV